MKLIRKGKFNRYFNYITSSDIFGFFYEGKFYEGHCDDYPEMNRENQHENLYNEVKTVKAFKRWLRVNKYNAPKGTEFRLVNVYYRNIVKGKIK